MVQRVVIENSLVSIEERTVLYQVPISEWLPRIEKRSPIRTPVLPLGTRSVIWDDTDLTNQRLMVLIEEQPKIIRMNFLGGIHELSIPWTRFFFYAHTSDPTNTLAWNLADYRVFWSKSQYRDPALADMIPAMLPNVYPDGRICFGSTGADMDQTLAERLNQTCNEFYVSNFNRDLTIRRPDSARSYRAWERMTQKDPTGWTKWTDWDPNNGLHQFFSFDSLLAGNRIPNIRDGRNAPMIAADGIPDVPMGATIGRINEWLDQFDNSQRDRLLQAMLRDRALNNERYETDISEFMDSDETDEAAGDDIAERDRMAALADRDEVPV